MSLLFFVTAVYGYLRSMSPGGWPWYLLSILAAALAMLSATEAIILPIVILLCFAWMTRKISTTDVLRRFLTSLLPVPLAPPPFGSPKYQVALDPDVAQAGDTMSRLAVPAGRSVLPLQGCLALEPLDHVHPGRGRRTTPTCNRAAGGNGCPADGILAAGRYRWGRPWLFGAIYYLVCLLPVLGLARLDFMWNSVVADHWQYFALIAPVAGAVAGVTVLLLRSGHAPLCIPLAAMAALLLGGSTFSQAVLYRDEILHFGRTP